MSEPQAPCPPSDLPDDIAESYRPSQVGAPSTADDELARIPLTSINFTVASEAESGALSEPSTQPGRPQASYVLYSVIGRGGFGEVWEARQSSLDRIVAIKRIRPNLRTERTPDTLHNVDVAFRREAYTTGRLDHPNIVPVHDLGVDDRGQAILAMKRVRGELWSDLLNSDRAMEPADFLARHLSILVDVSHAVAFAHSKGIIHRDLKPSQVMVGQFGEVLLMDWGLAVSFAPDATEETEDAPQPIAPTPAEAPNPAGTAAFMAPEQTEQTGERLGPWTDVYLLGGILYQILTGKPPHYAATAMAAFFSASQGLVDPPELVVPDRPVPAELSDLCMRALERDPSQRVASVTNFLEALENYLSGANRRRESVALTKQAHELLGSHEEDYEAIGHCDTVLERALLLWPDNELARELRRALLSKFARLAIDNGDLGLARGLVRRLANSPEGVKIRAAVDAAEALQRRHSTQRRVALAATAVLLVAAGALSWRLGVTRRSAHLREIRLQAEAMEQRYEADRARQRATLLDSASALMVDESSLAERILDEVPLPPTLFGASRQRSGGATAQQTEDALTSQLAALADRRQALAEEGGKLDPEPVPLFIAQANLTLNRANDTSGALAAFALYARAADERPGLPEPLTGMAIAAARAGFPTSATLCFDRALSMTLAQRGPNHESYAHLLGLAAEAYKSNDQSPELYRTYYEKSLSILEPQWVDLSLAIARQYRELGDLAKPDEFSSPALAVARRIYGPNSPQVADLFAIAGESSALKGDFAEGEKQLRRALQIRKDTLGTSHPDTATAGQKLAQTLLNQGRLIEAELLMREAVDVLATALGDNNARTIECLVQMAEVLSVKGETGEAVPLLQRALAAAQRTLGPGHPVTASVHLALGRMLDAQSRYGEAERVIRLGLATNSETLGTSHVRTLLARIDLADNLDRQKRFDESSALLREVSGEVQRVWGREHSFSAQMLARIAAHYEARGALDEAERFHRQAVAMVGRVEGRDSLDYALALLGLGRNLAREGYRDDGIALGLKSLELTRRLLGDEEYMTVAAAAPIFVMMVTDSRDNLTSRAGQALGLGAWLEDALRRRPHVYHGHPLDRAWFRIHAGLTAALQAASPPRPDLAARCALRALVLAEVFDVPTTGPAYRLLLDPFLAMPEVRAAFERIRTGKGWERIWPDEHAPLNTATLLGWLDAVAPPVDWKSEFPGLPIGPDALTPRGPALEKRVMEILDDTTGAKRGRRGEPMPPSADF